METKIAETIEFVKKTLKNAEAGHDWFHIERVHKTALNINNSVGADAAIVSFAALLHDIADSKFHSGDEKLGPEVARKFLISIEIPPETIDHVVKIIQHMSFKNSFDKTPFSSKEMDVVQDADRLDAIGAIGIARAFTYGGFKNRLLYNPDILPELNHTKESYKNTEAPTINHFYEKLLLLKDTMKTEAGKVLAAERHQVMLDFLAQFYKEWEGN
ncbi:MAG: HD domain-containing protein [Pedobacter sp.]|nr:HD domain-containing protein [Pedobacter sp.]